MAVYSDHWYRRLPDGLYADRALVIFLAAVAAGLERMVLLGQLDPQLPRAHYRVPDGVEFGRCRAIRACSAGAVPAMLRSLRRFWRLLDDVDGVWLLGPHPLGLAFALIVGLRRRRVALGVRQDFPVYVRTRHPGRRGVQALAELLERAPGAFWPAAARPWWSARGITRLPTRGGCSRPPSRSYPSVSWPTPRRRAPASSRANSRCSGHPTRDREEPADARRRDGPPPTALATDGLRRGAARGGPARSGGGAGRERPDRARGLPAQDGGLLERYRSAAAFLHVSWTEGVPQVLLEALGQGLPVVATDVGGVRRMAEGAALLIAPGDPQAAADALERLASDAGLRRRLGEAGLALARAHTLEAESERVAAFLAAGLGRR